MNRYTFICSVHKYDKDGQCIRCGNMDMDAIVEHIEVIQKVAGCSSKKKHNIEGLKQCKKEDYNFWLFRLGNQNA